MDASPNFQAQNGLPIAILPVVFCEECPQNWAEKFHWNPVPRQHSLEERVLYNLVRGMVLTRAKLRDCLAVKNEHLGEVLESQEALAG